MPQHELKTIPPMAEAEAVSCVVTLMEMASEIIRQLPNPDARQRVAAYADMFAGYLGTISIESPQGSPGLHMNPARRRAPEEF